MDISWLNSRKDTVGKDKEAELWAAARGFVEEAGNSSGNAPGASTDEVPAKTESQKMEVD